MIKFKSSRDEKITDLHFYDFHNFWKFWKFLIGKNDQISRRTKNSVKTSCLAQNRGFSVSVNFRKFLIRLKNSKIIIFKKTVIFAPKRVFSRTILPDNFLKVQSQNWIKTVRVNFQKAAILLKIQNSSKISWKNFQQNMPKFKVEIGSKKIRNYKSMRIFL